MNSKTNIYQLTENLLKIIRKLCYNSIMFLYTNTMIVDCARPVFNVFDKTRGCIATSNHIRCTVPKLPLKDDEFMPKDIVNALGSVRISLILKL